MSRDLIEPMFLDAGPTGYRVVYADGSWIFIHNFEVQAAGGWRVRAAGGWLEEAWRLARAYQRIAFERERKPT